MPTVELRQVSETIAADRSRAHESPGYGRTPSGGIMGRGGILTVAAGIAGGAGGWPGGELTDEPTCPPPITGHPSSAT